jgi:hypothetical protein
MVRGGNKGTIMRWLLSGLVWFTSATTFVMIPPVLVMLETRFLPHVQTDQGPAVYFNYGIAGVVALTVLYWKREDDKRHTEDFKNYIARLEARDAQSTALLRDTIEAMRALQATISSLREMFDMQDILGKMEVYLDKENNPRPPNTDSRR